MILEPLKSDKSFTLLFLIQMIESTATHVFLYVENVARMTWKVIWSSMLPVVTLI